MPTFTSLLTVFVATPLLIKILLNFKVKTSLILLILTLFCGAMIFLSNLFNSGDLFVRMSTGIPLILIFLLGGIHIKSFFITGLGALSNTVVVLFNNGYMPLDPPIQLSHTWFWFNSRIEGNIYKLVDEDTILPFLGDWIYIKEVGIISPGDLVIATGFILLLLEIPYIIFYKKENKAL